MQEDVWLGNYFKLLTSALSGQSVAVYSAFRHLQPLAHSRPLTLPLQIGNDVTRLEGEVAAMKRRKCDLVAKVEAEKRGKQDSVSDTFAWSS